jgi:hypothetical protein
LFLFVVLGFACSAFSRFLSRLYLGEVVSSTEFYGGGPLFCLSQIKVLNAVRAPPYTQPYSYRYTLTETPLARLDLPGLPISNLRSRFYVPVGPTTGILAVGVLTFAFAPQVHRSKNTLKKIEERYARTSEFPNEVRSGLRFSLRPPKRIFKAAEQ